MKSYLFRTMVYAAMAVAATAPGFSQRSPAPPPPPAPGPPAPDLAGPYTNVSGTILQFNYGPEGDVEGFLLANTLVHLPPDAASRYASMLHSGDRVQVAGFEQTAPTGFQRIEARSVEDSTSGKSFTLPQPGPPAPYSASGRIRQLNYAPDGAVNGFLLDNGTLAKLPPFSAGNPTSVRVGASVSYSGYAHRTMSDRTVVDVETLTIDGQPLALAEAGPGAPPPPPPPPPAQPWRR